MTSSKASSKSSAHFTSCDNDNFKMAGGGDVDADVDEFAEDMCAVEAVRAVEVELDARRTFLSFV